MHHIKLRSRRGLAAGFSLVELLISMTIMVTIMGATMTAMLHATRANETALLVTAMNSNLPITEMRTMKQVYDKSMSRTAFTLTLLAISADGVEQTLRSIDAPGGSLAGRPLIDCTNAVVPGDFTLAVPAMAELVASLAADAQVVKAFNLAADTVWRGTQDDQHGMVRQGGDFEGGPLGVPLCGDDPAAVARVGVLVRDLGCEPVQAGGLARARLLEATAAFAIGVWATGGDARSLFPTLARAFGSVEP